MKKILTISVAAYNVASYIGETLESFIVDRETMKKLEVLVVNDGSTDDTAEIVKRYVREYPDTFVLIDKENGGYGSTINHALTRASGKYFRTVDGDDWVDKDGITKFVRLLEDCDADLVITKYCRITEGTGKTEISDLKCRFDGKCRTFSEQSFKQTLFMWGVTYKTSLLKEHGIRITERCFYTDMEYCLKPVAFAETAVCYDLVVYRYRIGREGQSVALESWHKNMDQALKVTLGLAEYWIEISARPDVGQTQKNYVKETVLREIRQRYSLLWTMPDWKEAKQKAALFDQKIKALSPVLYQETVRTDQKKVKWAVRIMRWSKFRLFSLLCLASACYRDLKSKIR